MRFGLFGSASARRGGAEFDSSEGLRDFIDYNVEAEALGFHSTFVVEHHFTGYGQVSATLNLLTWVGARTRRLRLGTAVMVLPWHNPVLLAEQAATLDLLSGGRLDFGIGKGYRYNEFAGFRIGYRGEVKIEVTFEINTDGLVNVSACDVETGQKTSTSITLSSGMTEADIQQSIQANRNTRLAGHNGNDMPAVAS